MTGLGCLGCRAWVSILLLCVFKILHREEQTQICCLVKNTKLTAQEASRTGAPGLHLGTQDAQALELRPWGHCPGPWSAATGRLSSRPPGSLRSSLRMQM